MPNLFLIFITGLVAGGVGCMAVQGGLLAGVIATQETTHKGWKRMVSIVVAFLSGKLLAYTLLGFLLGILGSYIQPTLSFRAIVMTLASLFMIATALNLLNVHPIFRYVAIQPPRFLYTIARRQSHNADWFAPFFVGLLTVFLPCGTTQAMMVTAMQYGNPVISAGILAVFTLGTIPLFLIFGVFMQAASQVFTKYFAPIAAILIIALASWNLVNVAAISGIDQPVKHALRSAYCEISYCDDVDDVKASRQTSTTTPEITINASSYTIDNAAIPAGSEITLKIHNVSGGGCIQDFTIPKLGINKIVPVGTETTISFTAPKERGTLPFMCSMGMYRGAFIVE